jgi:heat shock protein HspQ
VLIGLSDSGGGNTPGIIYDLGVVITHKLYHYRGVIVSVDPHCLAGDTWYQSNKTQPSREQPWYHILVHDSGGLSTYVAQSNLQEDTSGQPVSHPRIGHYFGEFQGGRYQLKSNDGPSSGCGI